MSRSRFGLPALLALVALATVVVSRLDVWGSDDRYDHVIAQSPSTSELALGARLQEDAVETLDSVPTMSRLPSEEALTSAGEQRASDDNPTPFSSPAPYATVEQYRSDFNFNVQGKPLTAEQVEQLEKLISWLGQRLREKQTRALEAVSEAVSWKIELGLTESLGASSEPSSATGERMVVSRSTAAGQSYKVCLNAGEFGYVDTAYADARIEARWGSERIREFFNVLP